MIGAGGHARELLDVVAAINAEAPTWDVVGLLADGEAHPELAARRGFEIIGGVDRLAGIEAHYVIGIGSSKARAAVASKLQTLSCRPATLVHPAAVVGSDVELGAGCCVAAGAVVTTNVVLGEHTHLNVGASVSHDSRLGRCCTVGPGARVAGWVTLGDAVDLGIGAVCRDRVAIGDRTIVGAGAVVVSDLAADVTAAGVPARPIGI